MNNINEYMALREEIISSNNYQKGYFNLLYTVSALIFTFSFTQTEPLMFLTPVVVIIPVYYLNIKEIRDMLKLGCYLQVFYEQDNPGWETRLKEYHNEFKDIKADINLYIFLSFCGPSISIWRIWQDGIDKAGSIKLFVAFICLVYCLYVIIKNKVNYIGEREEYINNWKIIRLKEVTK